MINMWGNASPYPILPMKTWPYVWLTDTNVCPSFRRTDANFCTSFIRTDAYVCPSLRHTDANVCPFFRRTDANMCPFFSRTDANVCPLRHTDFKCPSSDTETLTCVLLSDIPTLTCVLSSDVSTLTCVLPSVVPTLTFVPSSDVPTLTYVLFSDVPSLACVLLSDIPTLASVLPLYVPTLKCVLPIDVPTLTCVIPSDAKVSFSQTYRRLSLTTSDLEFVTTASKNIAASDVAQCARMSALASENPAFNSIQGKTFSFYWIMTATSDGHFLLAIALLLRFHCLDNTYKGYRNLYWMIKDFDLWTEYWK
jgi:hypothetical protein